MGASLSNVATSEAHAWYRTERRQDLLRLVFGGDWVTDEASTLDEELRALDSSAAEVELDGAGIRRLDSAGAWLLLRTKRRLEESGARVRAFSFPPGYAPLFEALERDAVSGSGTVPLHRPFTDFLARVGRSVVEF